MGYERNDRGQGNYRYGRDRDDGNRGYRGEQGRSGPDRGRPGGYDYEDRGFFERAGDEVRSWFGDEEAERRREYDERYDDRYGDRGRERGGYGDRTSAGTAFGRGPGYDTGRGGYGSSYGADRAYDNRGSGYGFSRQTSGDYGRSHQEHYGSQGQRAAGDSYTSWRDRQMASLDRDYDEYQRENQSRFDTEFTSYRTRRQGQRDLVRQVQEHAEVKGSDGQHVGTVDHVRGDTLRLTRTDKDAGGHHHTIPSSWIESVDGTTVTISKTADDAKRHWREADDDDTRGGNERGLFGGRNEDRSEKSDWSGRNNLNRSFSGTY